MNSQPGTTGIPLSSQRVWSNLGSDKQISSEDANLMKTSNASNLNNPLINILQNPETTDRKNDSYINGFTFNGRDQSRQVQFTQNDNDDIENSQGNKGFLRDAPNIRATKINAINQKNGDQGEDIYMGTHTQEKFSEKHYTFFQKRLLDTIASENENETQTQKRKNTNFTNTNSNNLNANNQSFQNNQSKCNDSFHKNTSGQNNTFSKDNPVFTKENALSAKQQSSSQRSGAQSQSYNQSQINQQMKKSEFNKSETTKKKSAIREVSERLWAIKMWYICIIASIIGTILCLISFYISNAYSNKDVLCFVIYPICAFVLQTSLIAVQRLIFIKIKVIEQEKAQAQSFNREKINKKRFHSWRYFYTVYSNVSARLIFCSVVLVIIYAPIIEIIILPKLEPSGSLNEMDESGNFINSINSRRNFLLIQAVLRFLWVYIVGIINYILLNQEYSRVQNLAKSEQNQNADRNQYLGQIYKEFENDLVQLENRMHIGLNQNTNKTHTMAEFFKASFHDNAQNNQAGQNPNQNTLNNIPQQLPITAGQAISNGINNNNQNALTKKQSLAQFTMEGKKSNFLEVGTTNNIPVGKPISMNQFDENNYVTGGGIGTNVQISATQLTAIQLQKQRTVERNKQLRIEKVRDLLQFWIKISREDIFALTQNIFFGLTIFIVSIILALNVMTNYLADESEPGYYITFFFYFFFISLMFFKGAQPIRRRQQEISKKVIRPIFFVFASIGETSVHFELSNNLRFSYVISIIKFFMIILFLHIVPWVQQIILERDIQKEIENAFRQTMASKNSMRKIKGSNDFRPSHIVDIREINHMNDEKKIYQQNRLTLIQFLVAFCITDIASSASFIAVTFLSRLDNNIEFISLFHRSSDYYNIYLVLGGEIICFLLLIILTIYFFKRSIAESEFDQLINYSFVTYTRDLVISNLTAILLIYFFGWHIIFILINN